MCGIEDKAEGPIEKELNLRFVAGRQEYSGELGYQFLDFTS